MINKMDKKLKGGAFGRYITPKHIKEEEKLLKKVFKIYNKNKNE